MRKLALTLLLSAVPALAAPLQDRTARQTLTEIQQTLGLVPSFFKAYPESGLSGAWEEFKQLQLSSKTAIPSRFKELIGLAVAAQVPCNYCTYAHEKFARIGGANDAQIREAVASASSTRHWSTLLNGIEMDMAAFRKDADRIFDAPKQQAGTVVSDENAQPIDSSPTGGDPAAWALQDIEKTFGFVPEFFRRLPKESLAGAWLDMKSFDMAETILPGKYKELMGLAVASQIPCQYCVYFHTRAARSKGATEREISEALGMAALTRKWSTVLNGNQINEQRFRSEIDRIATFMRSKQKKPQQLGGEVAAE
jgi:AhpD family alkylhydroperoxidase